MEIITPRPDLEQVVKLYGSFLPDYEFWMRNFGANRGWICFSPRLHELTTRFKCRNYPELYQDEARIQTALFRIYFENDEEIKHFVADLSLLSPIEQSVFLNEFIKEAQELGQLIDENVPHLEDLDWSPSGQAKARQEWEKLTLEEQQQGIRFWQSSLMFSLASFHNFIALMVHGRKLTQLVGEAIRGNDDSFCLAVHIDRNILDQIPYFKHRYFQAQQKGEQDFLEALNYRTQSPQIKGKIRHRALYMLFAILEGTQWLDDLKHREILDICDRLNLDRYGNRIETENALTKRLLEYRQFQKFNL